MRLPTRGLLPLVAIVAVSGCGGQGGSQRPQGGEEGALRDKVAELQRLSQAGDVKRVCSEIFAPQLASSISAASESHSCVGEMKEQIASPDGTLEVTRVQIAGPDNATEVAVERGDKNLTLYFVKQNGEWRLRSVNPPLNRRSAINESSRGKKGR